MARQNGLLEMAPGKEHLTLPGPGGYAIQWSPGAVRYKLEKSPSGHLILPCDSFGLVSKNKGGIQEPMMTFFGNQKPHAKVTCDVGTQTECTEVLTRKQATNARKNTKLN